MTRYVYNTRVQVILEVEFTSDDITEEDRVDAGRGGDAAECAGDRLVRSELEAALVGKRVQVYDWDRPDGPSDLREISD